MRPWLLDLFCGAGGAAMGYYNAGFEVFGVDIEPQPHYPFTFVQEDALGVSAAFIQRFAAVHASPPCQAYSTLRHRTGGDYPDLVEALRLLLVATGLPYVIENVVGAPLVNPVTLCGSNFGLGAGGRQLRRHRWFESNAPIMARPCQHRGEPLGVYGTGGGGKMTRGYKAKPAEAKEAMGIDWMSRYELSQAIPPAYTEYIGGYLMAALEQRVAV